MLYGKWRPQGFDEVVGQDHVVRTLRNALASNQIAHAYLFSGPRGTGKTTTARILARAVNCANLTDGEPCNVCSSCVAIARGAALDLIEMDAASNRGIEDIRDLREKINFAPSDLSKKVYLLDEVHMLTDGAFNALLKTLEEPPPHAIFILATTDLHKMPPTVISRCQRYDFHRVPNDAMVGRLRFICEQEGFSVPEEGLLAIGVQARGGLRDAITLLEQVAARYGDSPTIEDVLESLGLVHDARTVGLVEALLGEDLGAALAIARAIADDGIDVARFTRSTIDVLRDVLPQVLKKQARAEDPNSRIVQFAIERGVGAREIAGAIAELAKADFRLDPASPIPLEVACAAAILGGGLPAASAVPATAANAARPAATAAPRHAPAATIPSGTPLSREERFLKDLYDRCAVVNPRLAQYLNSPIDVVSLEGEELELAFHRSFPKDKIERDGRTLVEQQAEALLGRPVRLKVRMADSGDNAPQRETRRGHLAEAARAIGATPVGKE